MANFIDYTGRDFDTIKESLKTYLQNQFPDTYTNFYESGIGSSWLNLVAWVGDNLSYYTDVAYNERFLAFAQERENVIAICELVGYSLSPPTSASVTVTFTLDSVNSRDVKISSGTTVNTSDGLIFELTEDVVITAGSLTATGNFRHGPTYTEVFTSDGTADQSLMLSRSGVADGSIEVTVNGTLWSEVDSLVYGDEDSQVYEISYDKDDNATIIFGDGDSGVIPIGSATISIDYVVGGGVEGNIMVGDIDSSITGTLVGVSPAQNISVDVYNNGRGSGGEDRESIDHAKYWAPRYAACLTLDTSISLLDGTERTIEELLDYEGQIWVYSYDLKNDRIVPGKACKPFKSGDKVPIVKVTLDNGESVRCTTDHPFLMREGIYKEAGDLSPGDSLMPLYRRDSIKNDSRSKNLLDYEMILDPSTEEWIFTHRMSAEFSGVSAVLKNDDKTLEFVDSVLDGYETRHHLNCNRRDNRPENIVWMKPSDHITWHGNNTNYFDWAWNSDDPEAVEFRKRVSEVASKNMKKLQDDPEFVEANRSRSAEAMSRNWKDPEFREKMREVSREVMARLRKDPEFNKKQRCAASENMSKLNRDANFRRKVDAINSEWMKEYNKTDKAKKQSNLNGKKIASKSVVCPICEKVIASAPCLGNHIKHVHGDAKEVCPDCGKKYSTGAGMASHRRVHTDTNHKVISVEHVGYEDVYDLIVEDNHNFALSAGVFVHNTNGRAVTKMDFETLAVAFSDSDYGSPSFASAYLKQEIPELNTICLKLWSSDASGNPVGAGSSLISAVQDYFDNDGAGAVRLICVRTEVSAGTNLYINIGVSASSESGFNEDTVNANVNTAIDDLITGEDVQPGSDLSLSQIYNAIQDVDGVSTAIIDSLKGSLKYEETIATAYGSTGQYTYTVENDPTHPGNILESSISITDGTQVITDDGNGNLIGDIDSSGTNTVDYDSGELDFTFNALPDNGDTVSIEYKAIVQYQRGATESTSDGSQRVNGTVDYSPLVPGTFALSDGSQVITDDGDGSLIGDVDPSGNNTIVYDSGAYDATFLASPPVGGSINSTYKQYVDTPSEDAPVDDDQMAVVNVISVGSA